MFTYSDILQCNTPPIQLTDEGRWLNGIFKLVNNW